MAGLKEGGGRPAGQRKAAAERPEGGRASTTHRRGRGAGGEKSTPCGATLALRRDRAGRSPARASTWAGAPAHRAQAPSLRLRRREKHTRTRAQARRPQAVQPHLRKCFDNLVKLKFVSDKGADISGMISGEGEEVPFYKPLKARGNVEKWLLDVEDWMCKTVHHICKEGLKAYPEQARRDWVREREAQTVSSIGMVMWCADAEAALMSDKNRVEQMKIFYQQNVTQLTELTELVRGKLTSIQRKSIVALVTQDVHNRDIVETMCIKQCQNLLDFSWQQQLRYYWGGESAEDDLVYKQVDAMGIYGYEYMGAGTRLVITPLTDRCWMTITGALHIKLGAAPAGERVGALHRDQPSLPGTPELQNRACHVGRRRGV